MVLDAVIWLRGGGCGYGTGVDVITLAATRAGGGQRDESGRREEEDVVTTVAAMLSHGGRLVGRSQ